MTIESGTGGLYDVGTDVVPDPEYPGLYQVVPEQVDPVWGVSVKDVLALALHTDIAENPDTVTDTVFGTDGNRKVTAGNVEGWIKDVASVVNVKLRNRASLTADQLKILTPAAASVVKVGAAAYLVDAAFPARAGVNDLTSYGNVLWTRYKAELAEMVTMLEEWIAVPPAGTATGSIAGSFPEPTFADDVKW